MKCFITETNFLEFRNTNETNNSKPNSNDFFLYLRAGLWSSFSRKSCFRNNLLQISKILRQIWPTVSATVCCNMIRYKNLLGIIVLLFWTIKTLENSFIALLFNSIFLTIVFNKNRVSLKNKIKNKRKKLFFWFFLFSQND